jgi:hypothetical protein
VPPPGALDFGVLGDTPYNEGEVQRLDALIDDMNRERLAFAVHVGDIGSGASACTDAWLAARKAQFARLHANLVLVPGDNEWVDCRDQLERLAAWRRFFCAPPFPMQVQDGEYCEHRRWEAAGVLFVTLNVQGSNNNVRNTDEFTRRMAAVDQWIEESAALAEQRGLLLVLFMQADPFVLLPHDGFAELRGRLARLGERMPERVFLVHGDSHIYRDDEPIPGVRRLEVWGSPFVSWVRGQLAGGRLSFSVPRYR